MPFRCTTETRGSRGNPFIVADAAGIGMRISSSGPCTCYTLSYVVRKPDPANDPVWVGVRVLISLQQLELRPVSFKVDIPTNEIDYGDEVTQSSVLHAEGSAQLLNHALGEVRVQGNLTVTMKGTCDRCLESASFPVERRFDLIYMPSAEAQIGGEKEIHQAGIEVGYYEGSVLALNDILREVDRKSVV